MPKAWSVQLEARDGLVPRLDGTSLEVFYADDSQSCHEYYPQLRLVIKAPQMLLPSHRKNIFCKCVLCLWIIIVSNNLTKVSCSDVTDLSGDTLGCPCLSLVRVEQGRGAEWRELQLSWVPAAHQACALQGGHLLSLHLSRQVLELHNGTVGWMGVNSWKKQHPRPSEDGIAEDVVIPVSCRV